MKGQLNLKPGAYPCMNLFTLHDLLHSLRSFDIFTYETNDQLPPFSASYGENNSAQLPPLVRKFHETEGRIVYFFKTFFHSLLKE